jgi:hypothetical protein
MSFPFEAMLVWVFVTAMCWGYLILREDAETIDMRALSGSTGAGIALVIAALLIFWMVGISR